MEEKSLTAVMIVIQNLDTEMKSNLGNRFYPNLYTENAFNRLN